MSYTPKSLRLSKESTYMGSLLNASVAGYESNLFYIDVVDENIKPDNGFIDPETAGYLEQRLRLPGGYLEAGDVGTIIDTHTMLPVLDAFCGAHSMSTNSLAAGSAALRSFVFKPGLTVPTMRGVINPNVPETVGSSTYKTREIRGLVIKALEISAKAREAGTLTLTLQGSKGALGSREARTDVFTNVRPFTFASATTHNVNDSPADIESFTMKAERVIADDNFALGSRYLPFIHAAGVKVSGSIELGFKDWAMFKLFWGASNATGPQDAAGFYPINIRFVGDEIATGFPHFLDIKIPKCSFDNISAGINKRERIIQTLDYTGFYDVTSGYAVRFNVQCNKKHIWYPADSKA